MADDDCGKEVLVPEKPWWPHIQCPVKGALGIMWGWGGRIFILALFGLLGTAGLSAYRVSAGEEVDRTTQENIKVLGTNQQKMDEAQRIAASQMGLVVKQLNALLHQEGVTRRIEAPLVKPTELKELE